MTPQLPDLSVEIKFIKLNREINESDIICENCSYWNYCKCSRVSMNTHATDVCKYFQSKKVKDDR
jgi:hypothetical protein